MYKSYRNIGIKSEVPILKVLPKWVPACWVPVLTKPEIKEADEHDCKVLI